MSLEDFPSELEGPGTPAPRTRVRHTMLIASALMVPVVVAAIYQGRGALHTDSTPTSVVPAVMAHVEVPLGAAALLPARAPAAFTEFRAAVPRITVVTPSAPAADEPGVLRRHERAIRVVLNRYRDAVSTADVAALRALWPTADRDRIRQQFAASDDQNVDFESCRVSQSGLTAAALCVGVMESGFGTGQGPDQVERTRWQFTLQWVRDRWLLVTVQSDTR